MKMHLRHTWKIDGLALALLVIVTMGLVWGLIRPAHQRIADNAVAAIELSSERDLAGTLARQLAARQAELRRLRAELDTFDHKCWSDTDRSRRIEGLFQTARGEGMTVEGVEPSDAERVGGRRVLPMRLAARSEFGPLVRTLNKLRQSQPDVVLRTLDTVPAPTGEGQLLINAEFLWVPAPTPSPQPSTSSTPAGGQP